jgi:hypothetical protein
MLPRYFQPFSDENGSEAADTKEKVCFEAEATVVYSKIGMGMGLAFTSIDPQQMGVLENCLGS